MNEKYNPSGLTSAKGDSDQGTFGRFLDRFSDWISPKKEREKKKAMTCWDVLDDYLITAVPVDKDNLKFYYKKRLVGRLFPIKDEMGRERYKIYIYYYKSDRRNKENRKMKKLDPDEDIVAELMKQSEQPYWKDGKVDISAEQLIWDWTDVWCYNTDAGFKRREDIALGRDKPQPTQRVPVEFPKN